MSRLGRMLGARLAGGWVGWLAFATVFAVAGAGVASGPLFVEAVGDALAEDALGAGETGESLVRLRSDVAFFGDEFLPASRAVEAAISDIDRLELGPTTYAVGATRTTAAAGELFSRSQVRIVHRDGAIAALEPVTAGDQRGVWISARVAEKLAVGPGDTVTVRDPEWPPLDLPVAGVYTDFDTSRGYWNRLPSELKPREERVFALVEPELFIVDEDLFFELVAPLGTGLDEESSISLGVEDFPPLSGRVWWESLPVAGASGAELLDLATDLAGLQTDVNDPTVGPGDRLFEAGMPRVLLDSDLLDLSQRVEQAKTQVEPAIASIAVTVFLIGLGVVALGAWFVARRRRIELRMWAIEGRSAWDLGLWSALGAALPAVAGVGVGAAAAVRLVRVFGPSARPHPGSLPGPALMVFLLAGLGLITLATALVVRRVLDLEIRRSWRWAGDLALYGVAAALLVQLLVSRPVDPATGEVDIAVMVFPIVGVAAGVSAVLRLLAQVLARLRRAGGRLPVPVFLAWRRLVSAATGSLALLVPIGVAAGVVVFSSTLVASLDRALDAKSIVSVGSNSSVTFARSAVGADIPPGYSIVRVGTGSTEGLRSVLLLVVDPESYPSAVPWRSSFGGELGDVLAALGGPGGRVPAIVTGPGSDLLPAEGVRRTQRFTIAYEVVGTLDAVPLMAPDRPTMMFRRDSLVEWAEANPAISGLATLSPEPGQAEPDPEDLFLGLAATLVSSGNGDAMIGFLESIDHPTNLVEERADALESASFAAPRWAFDYLRLLSYLALALAIGVFAFSAAEARRRRVLADAIIGRMGLTTRTEAAALAVEVLALILIAAGFGVAVGVALVGAVVGEFDPLPALFPALRLRLPAADLLAVSVLSAAAGWLVWWVLRRATRRADVAEVLRGG